MHQWGHFEDTERNEISRTSQISDSIAWLPVIDCSFLFAFWFLCSYVPFDIFPLSSSLAFWSIQLALPLSFLSLSLSSFVFCFCFHAQCRMLNNLLMMFIDTGHSAFPSLSVSFSYLVSLSLLDSAAWRITRWWFLLILVALPFLSRSPFLFVFLFPCLPSMLI